MGLSEKTQKMVYVLKEYDNKLRKNNDGYKHYFAPDVPEKVVKKLISNFDSQLAINGIVGFYDTTLFCTTKSGMIFTNDGVYYKYIGKALYFAYRDIIGLKNAHGNLYLNIANNDMTEYTVIDVFDMDVLRSILMELMDIDKVYGQSSSKSTGKVKKLDIPKEMLNKCNGIIHVASVE